MRKLVFTALMMAPLLAGAQDVVRYKTPGSNFPIAAAVEVPAGKPVVYLSGKLAVLPKTGPAPDTKAQTISVLEQVKKQLEELHLTLGDVVKMQVFLVADANKGGKMDFAGFMEGYSQFFGTKEQPNLPARSAMQVAGLANPAGLVEIEVVAVRP